MVQNSDKLVALWKLSLQFRVFPTSAVVTLGADQFFVVGGAGPPFAFRLFSSIPGLCPLDPSSTPFL